MTWFKEEIHWFSKAKENEHMFHQNKTTVFSQQLENKNCPDRIQGMAPFANSFRGKEEHYLVIPTNNLCRTHKVGEDPRGFLPKYTNIVSYWFTVSR
jgi:hypothetical protein